MTSTATPTVTATEFLPLFLVLGVTGLAFAAYATRLAWAGRAKDPRIQKEQSTPLLGHFPMEAFHWTMRILANGIVRLGITPDALTYLSLALTGVTVPLIANGAFAWGAFALLVGSAFDALDGIVARQQDLASDSGEVLDAVVDRYADALPLVGLILFYRQSSVAILVVMLAWVGSFAVSYVRAKAEAMSVTLRGGLMRRHERLLYLGIALLLGPVLPNIARVPADRPLTLLVVGSIGFLSNFAALQLMTRTRHALVQMGRGPKGSGRGH
jgi:CDP-diacylglycerol---glycerol-3-phosphate 3-phosphatidyltransferase